MTNDCKKCGKPNQEARMKGKYLQSTCIACERKEHKAWVEQNREKNREYGRKSYLKKVGGNLKRKSPLVHIEGWEAERCRRKSNNRVTRAKQARMNDELTKFVTAEAHDLRERRKEQTGIEWNVDHIIPLKGKNICGLHVWNNLQVIPKITNLKKGNKYATIHD